MEDPKAAGLGLFPKISSNAPHAPAAIPNTFFPVIGSFKKRAANSMAHNGILVEMMEASLGELRFTPNRKHPWFRMIANNEAPNNLAISLWLTCSGFWKKEAIQNRIMAPPMRKSVITMGVMVPPNIRDFETGDINPHMAFAPNIEA